MMRAPTLGLSNNNPGNLRPSAPPWLGQTGENKGFAVFNEMSNGIRALARNLLAYQTAHGINTIRGAIARWAPSNENDTAAYIDYVAGVCEVRPDDALDFREVSSLYWLTVGICEQENGRQTFHDNVTEQQIQDGINAALA